MVVALGDSITDGIGSTSGLNDRWPNFLARLLIARYGNRAPGVVDEGIGGNPALNPSACYGPSAVARLPGRARPARRAGGIVLEGINDIGYSLAADIGCEAPTPTSARPSSSAGTRR